MADMFEQHSPVPDLSRTASSVDSWEGVLSPHHSEDLRHDFYAWKKPLPGFVIGESGIKTAEEALRIMEEKTYLKAHDVPRDLLYSDPRISERMAQLGPHNFLSMPQDLRNRHAAVAMSLYCRGLNVVGPNGSPHPPADLQKRILDSITV